MELSHEDRKMIGTLVRDRLGMEGRVLEIDSLILDWHVQIDDLRRKVEEARDEREALKAKIHDLSNITLAEKFEVSTNTIWHLLRGR